MSLLAPRTAVCRDAAGRPRSKRARASTPTVVHAKMRDAVKAGEIEVCSTSLGQWVWLEELMAKALEFWSREAIEAALGVAVETVLPFNVQLTDLHARVPRYQVSMLEYFAGQHRTTVSDVLTRELDGVASEHAAELSVALPGFAGAMAWPDGDQAQSPC